MAFFVLVWLVLLGFLAVTPSEILKIILAGIWTLMGLTAVVTTAMAVFGVL